MTQTKTLFSYEGTKVVAKTFDNSSITLSIRTRGVHTIIQDWDETLEMFSHNSKNLEKIKKSIPFYIELAQAIADIKAEGWEVHRKNGDVSNGNVNLRKNGVKKSIHRGIFPSVLLNKRYCKKVLNRFPNQEDKQKAFNKAPSGNVLDELVEVGKEARSKIAISQAVKKLSDLETQEILQVLDKVNLQPTEADISRLLNTRT